MLLGQQKGERRTLSGLQPRVGGKPVELQVLCPHNGTAVLKALSVGRRRKVTTTLYIISSKR